ncbi:MAG: hypothetical protein WCK67_09050 [bacterium]
MSKSSFKGSCPLILARIFSEAFLISIVLGVSIKPLKSVSPLLFFKKGSPLAAIRELATVKAKTIELLISFLCFF